MNNMLDFIDYFDTLVFKFEAKIDTTSFQFKNKSYWEIVEWHCKTINGESIEEFERKQKFLVDAINILHEKDVSKLSSNYLKDLIQVKNRIDSMIQNFFTTRNVDAPSDPDAYDFEYFVKNKKVIISQDSFTQEELNGKRWDNYKRETSCYVTTVLDPLLSILINLKESISNLLDTNFQQDSNSIQEKQKDKVVSQNYFNFYSDFFSNEFIEVVDLFHSQLKSKGFIENCTKNTFRQIFSDIKKTRPVKNKINWLKGAISCKYFIEQLALKFGDKGFKKEKYLIANCCIDLLGDFYDFAERGSEGNKASDVLQSSIDSILKDVEIQISVRQIKK